MPAKALLIVAAGLIGAIAICSDFSLGLWGRMWDRREREQASVDTERERLPRNPAVWDTWLIALGPAAPSRRKLPRLQLDAPPRRRPLLPRPVGEAHASVEREGWSACLIGAGHRASSPSKRDNAYNTH